MGESASQKLATLYAELAEAINSHKSFNDIAHLVAADLPSIVQHDFLSITIFDENGDPNIGFTFLDNSLTTGMQRVSTTPVHDSTVSLVKPSNDTIPILNFNIKFGAHASVLLMSENHYLGNFAIKRVKHQDFDKDDIKIMQNLANYLSLATFMDKQKQAISVDQKITDSLINFTRQSANHKNPKRHFYTLQHILRDEFNATFAEILYVNNKVKINSLLPWIPNSLLSKISQNKFVTLLKSIGATKIPLLVDTPEGFAELFFEDEIDTTNLQKFQSVCISPIFVMDRPFAFLFTSWESGKIQSTQIVKIVETLTKQLDIFLEIPK